MSGRTSISKVSPGAVAASFCLALFFAVCLSAGRVGAVERSLRGELKRVLVLHSFGRDFRPWSEYARDIKAKLERESPWPLDIQEHALLTARFNNPGPEAPFVEYLQSLYQGAKPDIVLSIGAPAALFAQKYRGRLFPDAPLILSAVEHRLINRADLI